MNLQLNRIFAAVVKIVRVGAIKAYRGLIMKIDSIRM